MIYFISLGSNLGDKPQNLSKAAEGLEKLGVRIIAGSSIYRTEPVDFLDQPWFLNQVLEVESQLGPEEFLDLTQSIEVKLGRVRAIPKGPRIMDIDILLADDIIYRSERLTIPHPALEKRRFVLVPLNEMAPSLIHRPSGKSIAELLRDTPDVSEVRLLQEPGEAP